MTKTKNGSSDRRPYDIRRVSRMQPNKALSQDALDKLSLYEEVNRQFAQEFPQTTWKPCLLSPHSEQQEYMTTASADNATSTGTSAVHMSAHDYEFITLADYSLPIHNDAVDFDILSATTSPFTAPFTSPSELSDTSDPFATLSADFEPLWDLDAMDSLLPWNSIQVQGSCYCAHALQNKGKCEANEQEQLEGSRLMVPPPLFEQPPEHNTILYPEREPRDSENDVIDEESCVDRKNMNQIIFNLNQLGSRLRNDARRQLDVISDGCDAFPMSFGEG
ncbi:hypothetical protein GGI43DRAFT_8575 [Trichoderma evansii]